MVPFQDWHSWVFFLGGGGVRFLLRSFSNFDPFQPHPETSQVSFYVTPLQLGEIIIRGIRTTRFLFGISDPKNVAAHPGDDWNPGWGVVDPNHPPFLLQKKLSLFSGEKNNVRRRPMRSGIVCAAWPRWHICYIERNMNLEILSTLGNIENIGQTPIYIYKYKYHYYGIK